MEGEQVSKDEERFADDDVNKLVNEVIDETIGHESFREDKQNDWARTVVEQCVSRLAKREQNFKYIVDVLIMQRTGGGMHAECSCFWNDETDGSCTISWKNQSMQCIVTVFGLAC